MKIMLDCSPAKIMEYRDRYNFDFWQLRTPLTSYARSDVPYGLDNGCFKNFDERSWLRLVAEAETDRPVFVTLPDIVGDARRTKELFDVFKYKVGEVPLGLVLQDGIANVDIDWQQVAAVFIGGSDNFKIAPEAFAAAKTAKMLGKWVHVGRVNTAARVANWMGIADSIDGSGISRFDQMLEDVLKAITQAGKQTDLFDEVKGVDVVRCAESQKGK